MSGAGFFTLDDTRLVPTALARSSWTGGQLHGVALAGALARGLEIQLHQVGRDDVDDLVASRCTVDLFRPAGMSALEVSASVVRESRRLVLIDAVLVQDGEPVCRASALFLKRTGTAPGEVWSPAEQPAPPHPDDVPVSEEPRVPFFHSAATGWSQDFGAHQDSSRKSSWTTALPVVVGERPSGFVAAASVSDGASMVTNWGSNGIEHINTDITLTLAREPVGLEIGMVATDRVERDGIAVGTATVHDRSGPLGTAVVTSIANTRRTVTPEKLRYAGSPA